MNLLWDSRPDTLCQLPIELDHKNLERIHFHERSLSVLKAPSPRVKKTDQQPKYLALSWICLRSLEKVKKTEKPFSEEKNNNHLIKQNKVMSVVSLLFFAKKSSLAFQCKRSNPTGSARHMIKATTVKTFGTISRAAAKNG